jgi:hypothetical protein
MQLSAIPQITNKTIKAQRQEKNDVWVCFVCLFVFTFELLLRIQAGVSRECFDHRRT